MAGKTFSGHAVFIGINLILSFYWSGFIITSVRKKGFVMLNLFQHLTRKVETELHLLYF